MPDDDFKPLKVKALQPFFDGATSYAVGDVFALAENRAIEEQLARRVEFEPGALTEMTPRGRAYYDAIRRPPVPGAHALQY